MPIKIISTFSTNLIPGHIYEVNWDGIVNAYYIEDGLFFCPGKAKDPEEDFIRVPKNKWEDFVRKEVDKF